MTSCCYSPPSDNDMKTGAGRKYPGVLSVCKQNQHWQIAKRILGPHYSMSTTHDHFAFSAEIAPFDVWEHVVASVDMAVRISEWLEGVVNLGVTQAKLWNFSLSSSKKSCEWEKNLFTPVKAGACVTLPCVLFQKMVLLACNFKT